MGLGSETGRKLQLGALVALLVVILVGCGIAWQASTYDIIRTTPTLPSIRAQRYQTVFPVLIWVSSLLTVVLRVDEFNALTGALVGAMFTYAVSLEEMNTAYDSPNKQFLPDRDVDILDRLGWGAATAYVGAFGSFFVALVATRRSSHFTMGMVAVAVNLLLSITAFGLLARSDYVDQVDYSKTLPAQVAPRDALRKILFESIEVGTAVALLFALALLSGSRSLLLAVVALAAYDGLEALSVLFELDADFDDTIYRGAAKDDVEAGLCCLWLAAIQSIFCGLLFLASPVEQAGYEVIG